MKIFLILITTIVFSLPSIAKGEIDYVKSANNVTLIGSNTNIGSIISAGAMNNGSLKFEITAKRLYAASQRVL